MYYLMSTINGETICYGAYSHEFAVYAKKARLKKLNPYQQIEVIISNEKTG